MRLAAQRHLDNLKAQRRRDFPYQFDEWYANDVCEFTERFPHLEGHWKTATIHLEPAQVFILASVFGWRRKSNGLRRFNKVYIEMARKGAKSTLTAPVIHYCLTCEDEPGPQIPVAATTREQADKVFKPAKLMAERLPEYREAFGVEVLANSIVCHENGGFIQPINAKSSTQDGWNPYVIVLDELHAHRDRGLYDVLRSSLGARQSFLLWMITTAGYNQHGVCHEQRDMAVKVLEGALELDEFFAVIFTLDKPGEAKGDDPYDERTWVKANPLLGITPTWEAMRSYAAEARSSPDSEAEFFTKRLNIWLNTAASWLSTTRWNSCADPGLDWDEFDGLECWIGADLSDKDDITALYLVAFDDAGRLLCKPVFYVPRELLESPTHSQGQGPAPYRSWVKQGHLQTCGEDWIDSLVVEAQIRQWLDRYRVYRVTFDQYGAGPEIAMRLNEDYLAPDGGEIAAIMQKKAPNVTAPALDLEARVKAGKKRIRHDGNKVMNWMVSNVVVQRKVDGSIIPKKEKPGSPLKIDGVDALINGLAPALSLSNDEDLDAFLDAPIKA